eukprot:scaffold34931_cov38-Cyclotella_meneghiniana.AAC.2
MVKRHANTSAREIGQMLIGILLKTLFDDDASGLGLTCHFYDKYCQLSDVGKDLLRQTIVAEGIKQCIFAANNADLTKEGSMIYGMMSCFGPSDAIRESTASTKINGTYIFISMILSIEVRDK